MATDPFAPASYVEHAGPILERVVAMAGGELVRSAPGNVSYRPGRSITVSHHVDVSWHKQPPVREQIVVRASRSGLKGAAPLTVDDRGNPVHAFVVPADPALPGLATALDPGRAAALVDHGGDVTVAVRAYRPLRRAVIEATAASGERWFLKVVRPSAVEALAQRHALLAGAVPAPKILTVSDDGVAVLEALPGRTLREAVADDATELDALPSLTTITAVLDRLPADLHRYDPRPSAVAHVEFSSRLLLAVLPSQRARVRHLIARIGKEDAPPPSRAQSVHGDLYDAQLLVEGSGVVGLLDIDGAGGGRRADDVANLIGHLSASGADQPRASALAERYFAAAQADPRIDVADLVRRIAAVVLGLTTNVHRAHLQGFERRAASRLALAERWLRRS